MGCRVLESVGSSTFLLSITNMMDMMRVIDMMDIMDRMDKRNLMGRIVYDGQDGRKEQKCRNYLLL